MNDESRDPIDHNEVIDSSRQVELRGKVVTDIAKRLEKQPLDENAPEQEKADREALEAVRSKFDRSLENKDDNAKVKISLTKDDIAIVKNNLPQPAMGADSRIQHNSLDELEGGFRVAGQNEWVREKTSGFLGKAKQLFMKLFFH